MYKLSAVMNDGIIFCGEHRSLTKCEEAAETMHRLLCGIFSARYMTFIVEKNNECVCAWIYSV